MTLLLTLHKVKDTLNHLFAYRTLPQDEAHRVVLGIARGG